MQLVIHYAPVDAQVIFPLCLYNNLLYLEYLEKY